jgi:dihydroxy-acid dehydratase
MAYRTGKRIVDMVWEDLKPSDIMTKRRRSRTPSSSTRRSAARPTRRSTQRHRPHHRRRTRPTTGRRSATRCRCWSTCSRPANISARTTSCRRRAGRGQRADEAGLIRENAPTVNGKTIGENCRNAALDPEVIRRQFDKPLKKDAGFINCGQPVRQRHHEDQRDLEGIPRALPVQPEGPEAFEGKAIVFDGPEDYHHRIDDPGARHRRATPCCSCAAPARSAIRVRRSGEHAAAGLSAQAGITALPCIGDGRQSGTSGSPSILNASPEAAAGGGSRSSRPATACASTSTRARPTS